MANYEATYTVQGVLGVNTSFQDVLNSFSARLATYGGTVDSSRSSNFGGSLQFVFSLPDTKTVADLNTFLTGVKSDLGSEVSNISGGVYQQLV